MGLAGRWTAVPAGPSEAQRGPAWLLSAVYIPAVPVQKKKKLNGKVSPPYSSGKCHAILSCVGGIAATVAAKEGPRLWNR